MIEEPYLDKSGTEIKEFAVLKVFHFTGARRKKHFMYRWVRLMEQNGKKYWIAMHLTNGKQDSYSSLRATANNDRKLMGAEVVQQYE